MNDTRSPHPCATPPEALPPEALAAFPRHFVWGVSNGPHGLDGGARARRRGDSASGGVLRRQRPAIAGVRGGSAACEHVPLGPQDLDLVAWLGVDACHFPVCWPCVQPLGQGAWNDHGLGCYDRLVDGLLARGVRPYVTLNPWHLPKALQAQGGWAHRDTVHRFVDYAGGLAARLGDRVAAITTHHAPRWLATRGHEAAAVEPPRGNRRSAAQVWHHLLLSHGLALQSMRAAGGPGRHRPRLGIVLNLAPTGAAPARAEDAAAARLEDGHLLRWCMDPLFKGAYPADVLAHLGADTPAVQPGDLAAIGTPCDFLGLAGCPQGTASASGPADTEAGLRALVDRDRTVHAQGLTELLLRVHRDWPVPPLYLLQNGTGCSAARPPGSVHGADRTDCIARHVGAMADALRLGVPLAGYMVWSLFTSARRASGQAQRSGPARGDGAHRRRTPEGSAFWYREFLRRLLACQRHAPQGGAFAAPVGA